MSIPRRVLPHRACEERGDFPQHTHSSIGAEDIDTLPANTQVSSKWIQG
jgi:hypothetical protein